MTDAPKKLHWFDRMTATIAPRWTLKRTRARAAMDLVRHYEAAAISRRTQGWRKSSADANEVVGPVLQTLRELARDLVRNNPYAESALSIIADHTVGWGIVAKPEPANAAALAVWREWAESTACDADGRHDFYGLQKLIVRTVVESGEVLVRRRFRQPSDGFPIPMQLQVLDPDFLDTTKDRIVEGGVRRIVQGVEFDAIGRRTAYWLFKEHPGSGFVGRLESQAIPASEILHIFKPSRPGQVRAPSWFAPVLLMFKDFDEFADATLVKQKIAACLSVLTSDTGVDAPLGGPPQPSQPLVDMLEPGAILRRPPGETFEIVEPPQAGDYDDYSRNVLRAIATGLGTTYEDLTGDYQDMPFSAARMSRIRHWARVDDWRWRMLIPQFCDPAWGWAMQAAAVAGRIRSADIGVEWAAPPPPMVDPVNEGLAIMRRIRAGILPLSDALRELGLDPKAVFAQYAADNAALDAAKIVLDSDPRKMTQAGQLQGEAKPATQEQPTEPAEDREVARAIGAWPRR